MIPHDVQVVMVTIGIVGTVVSAFVMLARFMDVSNDETSRFLFPTIFLVGSVLLTLIFAK